MGDRIGSPAALPRGGIPANAWTAYRAESQFISADGRTVRFNAALTADAAEPAGVRRVVQVSSMGAGRPPRLGSDEVWAAYITAKTAAEADLRSRDLDWTILRPGGLTDAPATGKIRLAPPPVPGGTVPRGDVATVIAALLDNPGTRHQTLELIGGDNPIAAAVRSIS